MEYDLNQFIAAVCVFTVYSNAICGLNVQTADSIDIYVVSHGWHTGVIVPTEELKDSFFVQLKEYPSAKYLEIGWGDLDFYRTPDIDYLITVKAAVLPSTSALHIVQITVEVEKYFLYSDLIKLNFSREKFNYMVDFIKSAFATDSLGRVIPIDKGIYGKSTFYLGHEKYYFPKTCNVWTARLLTAGGIPINPLFSQRAGPLMHKLAEYGQVIRLTKEENEK